ncbi:adenine phosphoribosyltransferase [Nodosilinea sp. LEGE 07088]|uniref:adenine phosphoribosyltransferase n=1 Tax=Nodosilinea sp. LEGE 07088 TaxID=2777968 RepID=UPI00188171F4|nr:adenine phosphoribosyltransferase [Nodosilinea sp. LEGE 07088]MBE9138572.1 adenine phosphoribosyltransferase [Nodosilinea sp. LEGE 07088]
MDLKAHIRDIPDFPQPGILFRDITPLLGNPAAMQYSIDRFAEQVADHRPDYIVGIESRGFIFGMPLAYKLGVGFAPVRKPGKLPAAVHRANYALEYGNDTLELHQDAFPVGSRVMIVDDLIATGGTAAATAELIAKTGCTVAGFGFVIELVGLAGRAKLPDVPVTVLLQY